VTPRDDSPLTPAIRFMEEMLGWSVAGMMLLVSGALLLKWDMSQTWVAFVWLMAGAAYAFYTYPRLPGWFRECRRLMTDLRSQWPWR
jgi:hypothetical protein